MSSADARISNPAIRFRPLDIATLAYIFIELIIVLTFMVGRPGWFYLFLFYMAAAGIVFLIVIFDLTATGSFWRALRLVYPLFLLVFFRETMKPQIFLVFDHPFDSHVVALEKMIFGVDPAFALQQYLEIWLNELMSISYISCFLILPVSAAVMLFKRRWEVLERLVLASAVVFYVCHVIFVFYPVLGPRFFLSDQYYLPIVGTFFTPLVDLILAVAGLYGAAMPSFPCAVALVAMWILGREVPKTIIPSFVLLSLVCAGSVYGRYHYVSDVFAGLLIGGVILWLTGSWQRKFDIRIADLTSGESSTGTRKARIESAERLNPPL